MGGTNVSLTADNHIADEIVWNDAAQRLEAGGGGLSSLLPRPSYQNMVVPANRRSMLADLQPGYAIYCTTRDCRSKSPVSPWLRAGGTSAAAPLFAGGIALIDQALQARRQASVGFLNPLLYSLGGSSVFTDVTRFGNDIGPFIPRWSRQLGCCAARRGYDEASGWGSADMGLLAHDALAMEPQQVGQIELAVPRDQRPVSAHRLIVRVKCSDPCYAIVRAGITICQAGFFEAASPGFHLPDGGSMPVLLKFTHAQLAQLRAAVRRRATIAGFAYGVLTDSSYRFERDSPPIEFTITG
jgi:hypothetical protein